MRELLVDYLMPVCLLGAAFGILAYYYLLHQLHDIIRECYPNLLEYDPHDYRVNLDQPFQALKDVPPILKSGAWHELPSERHIRLCRLTIWVDRVWIACFAGLFLPFFF